MKLTIAIPTYNRIEQLIANLNALLPQMTPDTCLRIIDNCSEVVVSTAVRPLLDSYPLVRAEVIRNPANVGANANILRCLETSTTDWVWILGDDDEPVPGGVSTALDAIDAHPEAAYFNFSTKNFPIPETILTKGLAEFVDKMPSFSNVLFLSTCLFNAGIVRRSLRVGHHHAYTGASHIVTALMSIHDETVCCYSRETIVSQTSPDSAEQYWSLIAHFLGAGTILDLPFPHPVRRSLSAKLLATFPPIEQLVMQLLLQVQKDNDGRTALFYYDQIMNRLYSLEPSPVHALKRFLYRFLVLWPRLGYSIVSRVYGMSRKRPASVSMLHDRFARM
ncbi:MAG: glycosyltransferase family 2 protein [Capsulimonadaceae bacterium]